MIKLENVTYTYMQGSPFEKTALKNINLEFSDGEFVGLMGHTGSGKSTLIQLLPGLLKPTAGRITVDGEELFSKELKMRSVRFKVGLVMQYPEYQLFEETVEKDIAFGPRNMGVAEAEIKERVAEAADFAGLERDLLERSPFDLSGGQKRRAAIAGIIAMRPEILVLDEPAAGLDPRGRDAIFDNIVNYQRVSGSTVVIVSHSMEDMARLCDELVVMSNGEIFMTGDRGSVFSEAERLTSVGLDVPQITRLMNLLEERGISVDKGIYTVDGAYEFLKNKLRFTVA